MVNPIVLSLPETQNVLSLISSGDSDFSTKLSKPPVERPQPGEHLSQSILSSHRSTYFRLFCPNVHDFLPSSETLKIPLPIDVREIRPCDHFISFRHIDIPPFFPPKLGKLVTRQLHRSCCSQDQAKGEAAQKRRQETQDEPEDLARIAHGERNDINSNKVQYSNSNNNSNNSNHNNNINIDDNSNNNDSNW